MVNQRGWYEDQPYSRNRRNANNLAEYKGYADRAVELVAAANRFKRDIAFLAMRNGRMWDDVSERLAAIEKKLSPP